jgi:hypothetical protein
VPDPGEPTSPYLDAPLTNGFYRFYGYPLASSYQIPTCGGGSVVVTIPGPDGGDPSWRCAACGDHQTFTGDARELSTMGSAATHAVRCGHDLATAVDTEIANVKAEAQRVDPKATGYLQVAGILASAGFAVLAGAGRLLPGPAAVAGVVTAVLVLAAVVLLLLAGRPQLGGDFGFVAYVGADVATVLARLTRGGPRTELTCGGVRELLWRSNLLHTKYRRIRWAVPLLIAGFLGAAVTAALTMWAG